MALREKKPRGEGEPAGEIRLRQTAQVNLGDQTRMLEIQLEMPAGTTAEDLADALRQAEQGMLGISAQLEQQIALLHGNVNGHVAISAAPVVPALASGTADGSPADRAQPAPAARPEPVPVPDHVAPVASPTPALPAKGAKASSSMGAFLKAAAELGFNPAEIPGALGRDSLMGIDVAAALDQLRAIAAARQAPAKAKGFAEENGDYQPATDDGETGAYEAPVSVTPLATLDDLDGHDEPDFALGDDEGESEDAPAKPAASPDAALLRRRTAALEKLRELRGLRGDGAQPTTEMRTKFMHTVVETLGSQRATALITAIWNPPPGEKLNAPRMRHLVEWAVADDEFEAVADLVLQLAQTDGTRSAEG